MTYMNWTILFIDEKDGDVLHIIGPVKSQLFVSMLAKYSPYSMTYKMRKELAQNLQKNLNECYFKIMLLSLP